MKCILSYLFLAMTISSATASDADGDASTEEDPTQILTQFVNTKDLKHLIEFNKTTAEQSQSIRTKIDQDLLDTAAQIVLSPLEAEVTIDHVAPYPDKRQRIIQAILFCAAMHPKLKPDQEQKLMGACELFRTVDLYKLAGYRIWYSDKTAIMSSALDIIRAHYNKTIPHTILGQYADMDLGSRFAIQLGHFISTQVCLYRKRPVRTIVLYVVTLLSLYGFKRLVWKRT